jgi:hypothetical protein
MQIQLTEGEAKQSIFSLCYQYQVTGTSSYIDTANLVATQTTLEDYFDGINTGLGIEYPIPAEIPQDDLIEE